ncbi:hypothetical protein MSPP1_003723 [Malassezia sp. CBS 17886]|nr:hypothetical protein MSPP1_003723 [Malassezia sp. CBS 17886]
MNARIAAVVVAGLCDATPSAQLAEKIEAAAARDGGAHARLAAWSAVPVELVRIAFAASPVAPLLLEYMDRLCVQRPANMDLAAYDAGRLAAALLDELWDAPAAPPGGPRSDAARVPATISAICELILRASEEGTLLDSVRPAHLMQLMSSIPADDARAASFWAHTLRLVVNALEDTETTDSASARLFVHLVAAAEQGGWDAFASASDSSDVRAALPAIAARIESLLSQQLDSGVWPACLHALMSLQQGLSGMAETALELASSGHTAPTDADTMALVERVWGNRPAFRYACALQSIRRAPGPLAWAEHVQPEVLLLVHELVLPQLDWPQKCYMAHALLRTRLCGMAGPSGGDIRYTFFLELLLASAHAACACLSAPDASRAAALSWRAMLGTLLPPLFLFLGLCEPAAAQELCLPVLLAAWARHSAAFAEWDCLDAAQWEAAPRGSGDSVDDLRRYFMRSLADWHLVHIHGGANQAPDTLSLIDAVDSVAVDIAPASQPNREMHPDDVLVHGPAADGVRTPWTDPELAVVPPASELESVLCDETGDDIARVALVCHALVDVCVRDILFLFIAPSQLCDALVSALSRLGDGQWQEPGDLETIGSVVLFLQHFAQRYRAATTVPAARDQLPARAFLAYSSTPAYQREMLDASAAALVDRWCQALVGNEGITDDVLKMSPPWTLYSLSPTIFSYLTQAHALGLVDVSALKSALTYFLQAPLSYTLPCSLHWLVQQAQFAASASQYTQSAAGAPVAASSPLHMDLLCMLLAADSCPVMVREMLCVDVLALLDRAKAAHAGTAAAHGSSISKLTAVMSQAHGPGVGPARQPQWLLQMLSPPVSRSLLIDPARQTHFLHALIDACMGQGRVAHAAETVLALAQHLNASVDPEGCADMRPCEALWMTKFLAAACALTRDAPSSGAAPFSLLAHALCFWDPAQGTVDTARNVAQFTLLASLFARHLPGGPASVRSVFATLVHRLARAPRSALSSVRRITADLLLLHTVREGNPELLVLEKELPEGRSM